MPLISRTSPVFKTLPNSCNGACSSELCVTLTYLEPWHIHNLRNIWNPGKYLWCSIVLITLFNPGIFRILAYSKPEKYSEPFQASCGRNNSQQFLKTDPDQKVLH